MLHETSLPFQDYFPENPCFGCGPSNPDGLHIKTYWHDPERRETISVWKPQLHHQGPPGVVWGAIRFGLFDCNAVWAVIATSYLTEGRPFGANPPIWYVTGGANGLRFYKPVPIDSTITVYARVTDFRRTLSTVQTRLEVEGIVRDICTVFVAQSNRDRRAIQKLGHQP